MSLTCKAKEITFVLKTTSTGFPWWLSGKESARQHNRHGFEPWPRKIPPAVDPLRLCTATAEPALQSLRAANTEPACPGARALQEAIAVRSPRTATREWHPVAATRGKPVQQ